MGRQRWPSVSKGAALAVGKWLALVVTVVAALPPGRVVQAHGREVNIGVSCMTPDPARPLSKVCTAVVAYVDGDPVTDATLSLTASREDGDRRAFGPVSFQPAGGAGVYTAAFEYPAYGKWLARVQVTEPGEGQVELREEVLPPLPGSIGAPAAAARVRIVLDFDARELTNILVRAVHLGAAAVWFAVSVLVLASSLFLAGPERGRVLRSLARWFPWVTGGSFLLLALTGWYSAVYNVPARPPGLFDPDLIGSLPFGSAYLTAFLAKMGLAAGMVFTAAALAFEMRRAYGLPIPPVAGAALAAATLPARRVERRVVVLSALNVSLGILAFVDVVVLGYLHILTHIGGISGAR